MFHARPGNNGTAASSTPVSKLKYFRKRGRNGNVVHSLATPLPTSMIPAESATPLACQSPSPCSRPVPLASRQSSHPGKNGKTRALSHCDPYDLCGSLLSFQQKQRHPCLLCPPWKELWRASPCYNSRIIGARANRREGGRGAGTAYSTQEEACYRDAAAARGRRARRADNAGGD